MWLCGRSIFNLGREMLEREMKIGVKNVNEAQNSTFFKFYCTFVTS